MPDFLAEILTKPRNYQKRLALRAALRWRQLPDYALLPPGLKLTKEERRRFNNLFMQADQILKDETCVSCGTVYWHGHHADNNIEFELEEDTCFACQAKDEKEKQRKNGQGKNHNDAGENTYISTTTALPDTSLPARTDWLKAQNAEYQRTMAERAAAKRKAAGDGS